MLLLKNATIYPQTNEDPFIGDVLCEDGKIKEIGKDIQTEAKQILNLKGLHLMPGWIDCHSHICLAPGNSKNVCCLDYLTDIGNPVTPEMNTIYGANANNPNFRYAIENGVTTLGIIPGSYNVIDGTGIAIKTWGDSIFDMCIKKNICLKAAMGENPKGIYQNKGCEPDSRMGVTFLLEEYFENAYQYLEAKEKQKDYIYDEKYEAAIPVLKGEIPVRIHCSHNDMLSAIEIMGKFHVPFTLEHAWGATHYVDEIVNSGCAVVFGPVGGRRSFYESRFIDMEGAGVLEKRGVEVSLTVDSPVLGLDALLSSLEEAVRVGADPIKALRMVTLHPAKVMGVENRVGSIEIGKDANFAIFKGLPGTDMGAHVVGTVCEGEIAYLLKQELLEG